MSVMAKSAAPTAAGGAAVLLGEMANLSTEAWILLLVAVVSSVAAGAMARQGSINADGSLTDDQKRRARGLSFATLAAQILFGVVAAAQANGNLWITIPACLAIGWTGNAFLQWLSNKMGFGK